MLESGYNTWWHYTTSGINIYSQAWIWDQLYSVLCICRGRHWTISRGIVQAIFARSGQSQRTARWERRVNGLSNLHSSSFQKHTPGLFRGTYQHACSLCSLTITIKNPVSKEQNKAIHLLVFLHVQLNVRSMHAGHEPQRRWWGTECWRPGSSWKERRFPRGNSLLVRPSVNHHWEHITASLIDSFQTPVKHPTPHYLYCSDNRW